MPGAPIGVSGVRRLMRQQRVVAHPVKYHAGKHGFGFQECLAALEHCYAVKMDERSTDGWSWFALAHYTHGRVLRVDFDLREDVGGRLVLVVTAYRL